MELVRAVWEAIAVNSDVLLFLATVLLAVVTLFLVFESRAARLSATVAATPHIWQGNEDVMTVDLANVGPAPATAIDVTVRWYRSSGEVLVDWSRQLPALGPGHSVPYHPDTLLESDKRRPWGITRLAEEQLRLEMRWAWSDMRRSLIPRRPRRHRGKLDVDMATYRLTVHDAPNVLYRTEADKIVRGLEEVADRQRRYQELRDDDHHLLPPEIRVRQEAIQLQQRWALWRARLRYWILRQR